MTEAEQIFATYVGEMKRVSDSMQHQYETLLSEYTKKVDEIERLKAENRRLSSQSCKRTKKEADEIKRLKKELSSSRKATGLVKQLAKLVAESGIEAKT